MKHEKSYHEDAGRTPSKRQQVFVVDDDISVCRALGVLLSTFGFDVDTFSSADVFFSVVSDGTPGCLILDIRMPGCDGWMALERIMGSGRVRPVIVISADKHSLNYERALKAGAVGYLQKPFDDQSLVDLIRAAFARDGDN